MQNIITLGANEFTGFYLAKYLLEKGNNVGILDIKNIIYLFTYFIHH